MFFTGYNYMLAYNLWRAPILTWTHLNNQPCTQSFSAADALYKHSCTETQTVTKRDKKKCSFEYHSLSLTFIVKVNCSHYAAQTRLTLLIHMVTVVLQMKLLLLMDRMFSVYICIPWWLYLLLTTPNELTSTCSCNCAEFDLEVSEYSSFRECTHIIIILLCRAHWAYICGGRPSYGWQQHTTWGVHLPCSWLILSFLRIEVG